MIIILWCEDSTFVMHSSCPCKFDLHQRLIKFIHLKLYLKSALRNVVMSSGITLGILPVLKTCVAN